MAHKVTPFAVQLGGRLLMLAALASTALPTSAATADARLMEAIERGDRQGVQALLSERVDVNLSAANGATPLAWAVHRDDLPMAEMLIRGGATVNAENDYGVTPLSLACTNASGAMVKLLLKSGANPNKANWTGETPLMTCAQTGNVETVQALLAAKADPNMKESRKGQTALMWAAAEKHTVVVKALIAGGANVKVRSTVIPTRTPFEITCTVNDPCMGGEFEGTTYRKEVYFPKTTGGFTALLFSAQQGDMETARVLLDAGAGIDDATDEDGTPLVVATASGHEKLALYLLERGANPNAKDAYGMCPLHYALYKGFHEVSSAKNEPTDRFGWRKQNMMDLARALLAKGADPNAQVEHDFAPYDYAPVARSNGNNLPQITFVGATPFFLAAAGGDVAAMKTLVEGRANPKITTQHGATALMVAAGVSHESGDWDEADMKAALEATKMALALGADVNAVGDGGRTALHGAAAQGANDLVRFLVEHGADTEAKDKYGQSALTIAMGDPEGLVYRQLPGGRYDYSFRQPRKRDKTAALLVELGAKPFTGKYRDRSGE
ncbi:MAG: ankyrin repeat domain-containing protein [Acidobacteria bacterium]|nr:ankyrin repeat domain-containing protein [Acidobacteriota bacterium]